MSVRLQGTFTFDTTFVLATAAVSLVVAFSFLWLVEVAGSFLLRLCGSVVTGAAVLGVYFLGMAAVDVTPDATMPMPGGTELFSVLFVVFVVGMVVITVPIVLALMDPRSGCGATRAGGRPVGGRPRCERGRGGPGSVGVPRRDSPPLFTNRLTGICWSRCRGGGRGLQPVSAGVARHHHAVHIFVPRSRVKMSHEMHHFSMGTWVLFLAYATSVIGSYVGLSCVRQSANAKVGQRTGWIALAAVAIGGIGIWLMHFIGMMGVRRHRFARPLRPAVDALLGGAGRRCDHGRSLDCRFRGTRSSTRSRRWPGC